MSVRRCRPATRKIEVEESKINIKRNICVLCTTKWSATSRTRSVHLSIRHHSSICNYLSILCDGMSWNQKKSTMKICVFAPQTAMMMMNFDVKPFILHADAIVCLCVCVNLRSLWYWRVIFIHANWLELCKREGRLKFNNIIVWFRENIVCARKRQMERDGRWWKSHRHRPVSSGWPHT